MTQSASTSTGFLGYGPFDASWLARLESEFAKSYMQRLFAFLESETMARKNIYPQQLNVFSALNLTPFDTVKVVILGQDPYHGPGQAHGMSFSVPENIPQPPSLKNIFKELSSDLNVKSSNSGDLSAWARQGVLLLNSTLTVEMDKPGSHQGQGWEIFTDKIIEHLVREHENLVFILWGTQAQKKGQLIDRNRHLVLESAHPSPLSSYRGFFESKPFSKTNSYLTQHGISKIEW